MAAPLGRLELGQLAREPRRRGPVLFLLSSLIVGGSERKTVRLANALKRRGWDVHIAYLDAPQRTLAPLLAEIDAGIPTSCLGRRRLFSLPAALRLLEYIRARRIASLVCVNLYPLCYAMAIAPWLRIARVRWIAMANTTTFSRRRDLASMYFYKKMLMRADCIVFGCRYQQALWVRSYGLEKAITTHLYNGTDTAFFDAGNTGLADGWQGDVGSRPVIGTVGQLRPEKNHRELLLALAPLFRDGLPVELVLVGDGPERPALQALAKKLGMEDSVSFLGQLAEVRAAIARMDVFVISSTTETFSNAALEAMAMSRAVVMSRVGGAAEMIDSGHDGYLYESGRPAELSGVLRRLIASPDERRRLGANARTTVEARFTFDRMVSQFEELLSAAGVVDAPTLPERGSGQ